MTKLPLSCFIALLMTCLNLQAHNLRLFANQQGLEVNGEAYFAGAGPASNAVIHLKQEDQRLLTLTSDAEGVFTLTLPKPGRYELIADAGQGHQVSWPLTPSVPASSPAIKPAVSGASPATVVPTALSDQLRALQRDIDQLRSERRLQDVIGGLGYILGLAGLAAWMLSRRRRAADAR